MYIFLDYCCSCMCLACAELGEATSSGKATTRRGKGDKSQLSKETQGEETQAKVPFNLGLGFWPGLAWPGRIIPAENQYNPGRALRRAGISPCVCESECCCVESRANRPPTGQNKSRPPAALDTVQRFRGTLETKTKVGTYLERGGPPRHFPQGTSASDQAGDRGLFHLKPIGWCHPG